MNRFVRLAACLALLVVSPAAGDGHVKTLTPYEDRLDCVPQGLHDAVMETVGLYEELLAFRDDPQFARVGFQRNGPYYDWMRRASFPAHGLSNSDIVWVLGFGPLDVGMLGNFYYIRATDPADESVLPRIEKWEGILRKWLALPLLLCPQQERDH